MGIQKINPAKPDEIGIAEVLLQYGADANCLSKSGDPPLICAIVKKNFVLAKALLKYKANPNLVGVEENSPLSLSILTLEDEVAHNFAEILLQSGAVAKSADKNGNPLLALAVEKGFLKTSQILLKFGADPNCPMNGNTPLFTAISAKNVQLVELLLKYKANCNEVAIGGESAICMAVKYNAPLATQFISLLLPVGANTNVVDRSGNTPLFLAVMKGRRFETIIHRLIDQGADVNGVNSNGNTILHVASKYNSPEVVRHLLKSGANPNAKNESGNSPVHIACKANRPEILEVLIEFNADFFAVNDLGDTPLHAAASVPSIKGRNKGLEFLLLRTEIWKEFLTLKNNRDKTPLDIAGRDKGNLALMKAQRGEKVDFSPEEEEAENEPAQKSSGQELEQEKEQEKDKKEPEEKETEKK